jgi:hypothetical protein
MYTATQNVRYLLFKCSLAFYTALLSTCIGPERIANEDPHPTCVHACTSNAVIVGDKQCKRACSPELLAIYEEMLVHLRLQHTVQLC